MLVLRRPAEVDENSWYFYTNSGAMKTGWLKDKESWYYLDPETGMRPGSKETTKELFLQSLPEQVLCKLMAKNDSGIITPRRRTPNWLVERW